MTDIWFKGSYCGLKPQWTISSVITAETAARKILSAGKHVGIMRIQSLWRYCVPHRQEEEREEEEGALLLKGEGGGRCRFAVLFFVLSYPRSWLCTSNNSRLTNDSSTVRVYYRCRNCSCLCFWRIPCFVNVFWVLQGLKLWKSGAEKERKKESENEGREVEEEWGWRGFQQSLVQQWEPFFDKYLSFPPSLPPFIPLSDYSHVKECGLPWQSVTSCLKRSVS